MMRKSRAVQAIIAYNNIMCGAIAGTKESPYVRQRTRRVGARATLLWKERLDESDKIE
jgi:hypothetical protein